MAYIEGFLTPVPAARKADNIAHAERAAPMLKELGVVRMVENWGHDVPRGKLNDMYGAVAAEEGEVVVFSWFEYPDRATRDAASERMMNDPRFADMMADMPFDARRMVYGGFASVHDHGIPRSPGYVDGVLMPITADGQARYAEHAARLAPMFADVGALRVLDAIEDDVNAGDVTDFHRAVHREGDERVGFGWIEWPDKATRDAGWNTLMADERMQNAGAPPYDGKRMIFGGFATIIDV
ncbi:uncharacterized protein YbaA (DUF1428 family) [Sphingomonas jinjuensis]|uniref:Uncharacterized protein YbaA (DUF1428 family) n=1 Tax=Sphingomonas jinjuensis TaxID=535907 RepID=A0A840FH24_9SPHN|nr:DUF1428 family protein [Sphingomonas jinjuensis]MBB4155476.1 uncharacterized protein YbaA (DUF1428 family) [Sphingomonas jinjuensis]